MKTAVMVFPGRNAIAGANEAKTELNNKLHQPKKTFKTFETRKNADMGQITCTEFPNPYIAEQFGLNDFFIFFVF